jgi:hypothetical protein
VPTEVAEARSPPLLLARPRQRPRADLEAGHNLAVWPVISYSRLPRAIPVEC